MKAVQSVLTWAAIAVLVLLALPVIAVIRLFDRTPARVRTGRAFRDLGALVPSINPAWSVRVGGVDPAALRHPYVVVSNHQSLADIPVISKLPWEMKWVTKAELFRVPVMGWLQRMAEDIPVDRRDPNSRSAVVLRARRVLAQGCSVMFFAEGTRSRDGRLKRFYDGAFSLAVQAGVPVLPLAIDGTMDAIPKHGWTFGRADVRLAVLPPVPTEGLTEADVPALRERVRGMILDQIAAWRERPPDAVDALARPALGAAGAQGAGGAEIENRVETPHPAPRG
ncbi:lysophospholipid acyltransferase family protein [Rubrivirga sp. S365]|uniref:Lysophospholipid acyltransferase family protein n=1 Tax=Rubrivirga litoralis TaxID=3075598 RepID=A0ABU3BPR7_9BACT|nr:MULTISPECIES: lysophospholipid acyltransferase family protein [unclassified Rubrivirga]MDT0631270.1 lysophospholipid acyltransferase family protein [Rubrivirga sp. F394]MDT7856026.1 lysophospholipid acyltransferase family protein [Rubrivirga sp. S365]